MSSLASHGHAVRLPRDLVPDSGVEDEEQLAHGHDEGHLPGLAAPAQAGMEVADGGVVAGGGHGGHARARAHGGAPALVVQRSFHGVGTTL